MNSNERSIVELYVGLIGRAPDRAGLDFWLRGYTNRITEGESPDAALSGVAQDMFDSDGARDYYPSSLSDSEIVAQFYENVLGRTGDPDGTDFWTRALEQPDRRTGEVLVEMIESVKRYSDTDDAALTSQALFKNKTVIAEYYTNNVSQSGADADIEGATALLDAVSPQTDVTTSTAVEGFVSRHYPDLSTGSTGPDTDGVIDAGDTVRGNLERSGDQDWFRIEMSADLEYGSDLSGDFDGVLRLMDDQGGQIAFDDDSGTGWDAGLTFSPGESGTFYIVADSYQGYGDGYYSLSTREDFIPVVGDTEYVGDQHASYRYGAVTYVEATFPNGRMCSGSGAVVGQNDVLTASHVVYSAANGGLADSITVYPGRDGTDQPYGSYTSTLADYYEVDGGGDGMFYESDSQDDLALLGFDTALGNRTGWFGLDANAGSGNYNLTGYPDVYSSAEGPRMTNDYGAVTENNDYYVFNYETIESNSGNSGGPLWYEDDDGEPFVAGVVSTSGWATDIPPRYRDLTDAIDSNDYLFERTIAAATRRDAESTAGESDVTLVGVDAGLAEASVEIAA